EKRILYGVLITVMGLIIGIIIFLYRKRGRAKMSKNLIGIDKINEKELAALSGSYIEDVHAFLHDLSRDPRASGVSILVKGQYIYFSNDVVKRFKLLYRDGKNSKEILAEMPEFELREEVKKMIEKLKEFGELPERKKK
ncbi:MAG: hypothetical protein ACTSRA_12745, partial [Promethearchaeota archaeon]